MLLTPRDADRLPLALGAKVPPDATLAIPNLTKVEGRDHMFKDAQGRMMYLPPLPPYPRRAPPITQPEAAAPAQAPVAPSERTKPRPVGAPPDATHIGGSGAYYKPSDDGGASGFAWCCQSSASQWATCTVA